MEISITAGSLKLKACFEKLQLPKSAPGVLDRSKGQDSALSYAFDLQAYQGFDRSHHEALVEPRHRHPQGVGMLRELMC